MRRDRMNIGFIGAGKVGCTLGKYFAEGGASLSGYYSASQETSHEAAHFTNTCSYNSAEDLIRECDCVFVTVPDGEIPNVWNEIRDYDIKDKIICHCSGAMTASDAFYGIEESGAVGYSVHPLFAVSDRFNAYREMSGVFFTVEGAEGRIEEIVDMLSSLGNPVRVIRPEDKTKYHCAAAVASNLVCSVLDMSFGLMVQCGFEATDARKAMAPLIEGNVEHVISVGAQEALTGPIERNDTETVAKHIKCLKADGALSETEIYKLLSNRIIDMASRRHPNRNYEEMYQLLGER